MHASQLTVLAAHVAIHGGELLRRGGRLGTSGLNQYWNASRERLDRWHTATTFPKDSGAPPPRAVLEEVLLGGILTRLWTALAVAHDATHHSRSAEPIARSVYIGQLEARNRTLHWILRALPNHLKQAEGLNRLRRRAERWNDLLLARLMLHAEVSEFAFDADRMKDFCDEIREEANSPRATRRWSLTLASLQSAFVEQHSRITINGDLNQRIAAGVVSSFPGELFDSTGTLEDLWRLRLEHTADDTQELINDLLASEAG